MLFYTGKNKMKKYIRQDSGIEIPKYVVIYMESK